MKMHLALWAGLALLLAAGAYGMLVDLNGASAALVDAQRHFHATVTTTAANIVQVIDAARNGDYWIRIQTGEDITYLKGTLPCNECTAAQEAIFFVPPQLYVDGSYFWIHLQTSEWELHLRPQSPSMQTQYELVLSPVLPKIALDEDDLDEIQAALAPFAILGTPVTSIELTPLETNTKVSPPAGVRIDSVLYALIPAPDWNDYAKANGIGLSGLRARVLIELTSENAELPESLNLVIESRSSNFVRAQVLIHRLAELASHPSVSFVRLPSTPQPPAP